jgi:AraC-like DNA-binding protein
MDFRLYKEILSYLFVIGAGQGFILFYSLFNKKENRLANKIVALCYLFFAVDLLFQIYIINKYYYRVPQLIGMHMLIPYIYGPSMFLHIYFLNNVQKKFSWKHLLNYAPFIIGNVILYFIIYSKDAYLKITTFENYHGEIPFINIMGIGIPLHGITYVVLSIIEAKKFNRKIRNSYSNVDKIELAWLNIFIVGSVSVWAVVVFAYYLQFLWGENSYAYLLIYVALSLFLYVIGYKILHRPQIYFYGEEVKEEINFTTIPIQIEKNDEIKTQSYKKSGLNDDMAESYLEKLYEIMIMQKPFVDSKLSLADLSELVGISTHNLSEIINTRLNQNFYDFINGYRVEEVKRLIEEDKENKYNLLSLAFEAGFSSKSSFNNIFKRITGNTPSQFRDRLKEEIAK